jgi:hypothetical protein
MVRGMADWKFILIFWLDAWALPIQRWLRTSVCISKAALSLGEHFWIKSCSLWEIQFSVDKLETSVVVFKVTEKSCQNICVSL